MPAVLALWSESAKKHAMVVGDIIAQPGKSGIVDFNAVSVMNQPSGFTDLRAARLGDQVLAIASLEDGTVTMLLPNLAEQSAANGAGPQAEHQLLQLRPGGTASLDVSTLSQQLLVVGLDGGIHVAPLAALAACSSSGGDGGGSSNSRAHFREADGYAGFSQGRWADSHTFVTSGVVGGLQVWDVRVGGGAPVRSSPATWGHTGCRQADAAAGAARQLLCLDVHPSRPNLCASGSSGGGVAAWDLRLEAAPLEVAGGSGDVWEVRFDPAEAFSSSSTVAAPPLLYCTSEGVLCRSGGGSNSAFGSAAARPPAEEVLMRESGSIDTFDVEPGSGHNVLAATEWESLLLLQRTPLQ